MLMYSQKLSVRSFSVARILMALCVFLCHCFESLNYFGFLFVGVFFFMSGYGMEIRAKRLDSLVRLSKYLYYFVWFSLLYFLFYRVYPYPSSWFLIVYFLVMLLYRLISDRLLLLVFFLLLSFLFAVLEMYGWSTSFGAFFFGMVFTRIPFDFKHVVLFLPMSLLLYFHLEFAAWGFLPLFSWLVLSFSSFKIFSRISFMGDYTFYFYCVHCFFLGLYGCTWTLGGSPNFMGCFASFCASVGASVFLKEYLFNYPKIQKAG